VILIGQYDSPFVRRVAIALRLYDIAYEHCAWSVFADGEKIERYNPLRRVPTLILDDGEVLIESTAILDHLDERVGPARALVADHGPDRRRTLKVCALAMGLADKAVSLLYERVLHQETSPVWLDRCRAQITAAAAALEAERASVPGPYWFGAAIGHADIAAACALRFTREAHPGIFDEQRAPALAAHAARCESLPVFKEIAQPLAPPS
jgi:glutathione S-transferase